MLGRGRHNPEPIAFEYDLPAFTPLLFGLRPVLNRSRLCRGRDKYESQLIAKLLQLFEQYTLGKDFNARVEAGPDHLGNTQVFKGLQYRFTHPD